MCMAGQSAQAIITIKPTPKVRNKKKKNKKKSRKQNPSPFLLLPSPPLLNEKRKRGKEKKKKKRDWLLQHIEEITKIAFRTKEKKLVLQQYFKFCTLKNTTAQNLFLTKIKLGIYTIKKFFFYFIFNPRTFNVTNK